MRELPADAWERFIADSNESALIARLCLLPTRLPPQDAWYPEYHRICDVELSGQAYRVSRLVDLDDGHERLFIEPTDTPKFDQSGVPHWLRGAALLRWVRDVAASPTDDDVDWEAYRSGEG